MPLTRPRSRLPARHRAWTGRCWWARSWSIWQLSAVCPLPVWRWTSSGLWLSHSCPRGHLLHSHRRFQSAGLDATDRSHRPRTSCSRSQAPPKVCASPGVMSSWWWWPHAEASISSLCWAYCSVDLHRDVKVTPCGWPRRVRRSSVDLRLGFWCSKNGDSSCEERRLGACCRVHRDQLMRDHELSVSDHPLSAFARYPIRSEGSMSACASRTSHVAWRTSHGRIGAITCLGTDGNSQTLMGDLQRCSWRCLRRETEVSSYWLSRSLL